MKNRCLLGAGLAVACLCGAGVTAFAGAKPAAGNSRVLFERRILPLLNARTPSSCAECHLSGVELKDYIRPSEAETYASLRKQGLVDERKPGASKLLRLIRMSKPKSALLTQKARDAEYTAFAAWIEAAARNPAFKNAAARPIGPKTPVAVIRHARQDRVMTAFEQNVWSQEGRCSGCHAKGSPGTERFSKQFGARMAWIIPNDPEATLKQLLAQKAIDLQHPEQSPLLLKPIGELGHAGGVKFLRGDRTYRLFLDWLTDYARTVKGGYSTAESLPQMPPERLIPTGSLLTIEDGPEAWIGKSLRVDLFAWNSESNQWAAEPIATADRAFDRGHGSNLPVFRIVRTGAADESTLRKSPQLAAGRYLLKFYLGTTQGQGAAAQVSLKPLGNQEITTEWKPERGSAVKVKPNFTRQ